MNAIVYYLTMPILYLIAWLPFWALYRLSDFLFVTLYYIAGYRKKVVMDNLRNSFPGKSEEELKKIQFRFYRYLCDLIVEVIKTLTISKKQARKRLIFKNIEVLEKYYAKQQSVIATLGHWGNWELGGSRFASEPMHKLYVIYRPLRNKYFDRLIYHMRTRLGNGLYKTKGAIKAIIENTKEITATAFIADQAPSPRVAHWMNFLNQDTPVFTGAGRLAIELNRPVVYVAVRRIKRGKYLIELDDLIPEPRKMTAIEIVETYTRRLEQDIIDQPEIWLWTHRRWKHKRKT